MSRRKRKKEDDGRANDGCVDDEKDQVSRTFQAKEEKKKNKIQHSKSFKTAEKSEKWCQ